MDITASLCDIDVERCVLASAMLDADVRKRLLSFVREEDFFLEDHQLVWRQLAAMASRGEPIDGVLLRQGLARAGQLEAVGGTKTLATILASVPTAAHGEAYAKQMRALACWRELYRISTDMARDAVGEHRRDMDVNEAAASYTARIREVVGKSATSRFLHISQILPDILSGRSALQFIATGWNTLDDIIGGLPVGGMTIIGGRPMMGKSWFAKVLATNIASRGTPVAIISVEETADKVATNMLSTVSGVPNNELRFGRLASPDARDQAEKWAGRMSDWPIFVCDTVSTLEQAEAAIAIAADRHGAKVVIVDYLQLLQCSVKSDNENYKLTVISNRLKLAFRNADVCGVVPCQLNRAAAAGDASPPTLAHLRGTGTLEQDGDVILLLHSTDYYHRHEPDYIPNYLLDVIVAKNKNNRLGTITFGVDYDRQSIQEKPYAHVPDFT